SDFGAAATGAVASPNAPVNATSTLRRSAAPVCAVAKKSSRPPVRPLAASTYTSGTTDGQVVRPAFARSRSTHAWIVQNGVGGGLAAGLYGGHFAGSEPVAVHVLPGQSESR